MVIADGSIITANENENSDLFWAIRGGGCNFGVCVEFVYKLHVQHRTVYSGLLIYPPHLLDDVLRVTSEWWKKGPGPQTSLLQIITRGPAPGYAVCNGQCQQLIYLSSCNISHVLSLYRSIMVQPTREGKSIKRFLI